MRSIHAFLIAAAGCALAAPRCGEPGAEVCSLEHANGPALLQVSSRTAIRNATTARAVHFIYTVGCDRYQLVQAVVLDHTWARVGNEGRLTRIVAGCINGTDERSLLRQSPLRDDQRFATFFAEGDIMTIPRNGDRYPARSRPFAIQQWLDAAKPTEGIVTILDPDFVFQRPISTHPGLLEVRPGSMLAQKYDLGSGFLKGFQFVGEVAPELSFSQCTDSYATGPPWIMDTSDLRRMLPDWGRYTDHWPRQEGLLREQFSFAMAAARHNVPALGQSGLQVSSWMAWNEAWSQDSSKPEDWKPYVLHYCQTYEYGQWAFYKALLTDSWYSSSFDNSVPEATACDAPQLQEPPPFPTGERNRTLMKNAWMLSKLIPALNQAYAAHRKLYCKAADERDHTAFLRTMQPRPCGPGSRTRYLAEAATPVAWTSLGAKGGDPCSPMAQGML